MNYFVKERKFDDETAKTAWSKARDDAERICAGLGYAGIPVSPELGDRVNAGKLDKLKMNVQMGQLWKGKLDQVEPGSALVIQLPVINNCLFLAGVLKKLKKKKIRVVGLVHDLEILRMSIDKNVGLSSRLRMLLEEKSVLRQCDKLIVHNEKMKAFLAGQGLEAGRMVSLEIFDYLMDPQTEAALGSAGESRSLIVAGNLSPDKAGYVYEMPEGVDAELYGVFYKECGKANHRYHGSFRPDELPAKLRGGFGLIWDGPSAETCTGTYGEYLRYNNPHKTSLYLASELPVVIWDNAAMADFVRREGVGITAVSVAEGAQKAAAVSEEEYARMRANAREVGKRLRDGFYLKKALAGQE